MSALMHAVLVAVLLMSFALTMGALISIIQEWEDPDV